MGSPKEHLLKAIELQPDFTDARYQLALVMEREGDYPGSISQLEDLLQIDPSHADALQMLSRLEASHGAITQAQSHLQSILENDPRNPDAHFQLAMTALKANQPHDAIYHFEKTLQQDPDRLEAYFQLGLLHNAPEDFDKARSYFETTVDYEPTHKLGHYHLGLHLVHGKRYNHTGNLMQGGFEEEARNAFEATIQLDPDHSGAFAELGQIQAKFGEKEPAIQSLQKALKLDPSSAEAWLALEGLQPPTEALETIRGAVAEHPGHPTIHLRAAQLYQVAKDTERALHHFRQTIDTSTKQSKELQGVATELLGKNQFAKARDIESEIDKYNQHRAESHYQLSLFYGQQEETGKSRKHLEDGISCAPNHPGILHSLAILEAGDDHTELAIEYLRKSVEIDIHNPEAHFLLATLLEGKGDIEMSQNHYLITLDLYPGHKEAQARIIPK